MLKKGKRIISTIPDGEIWDYFLRHIESVHGKTYGYIGLEVQNALKKYVETYEQPNVQNIVNNYQRKIENMEKKYVAKVDSLEKRLNVSKNLVNQTKNLQEAYKNLESKFKLIEVENDHLRDLKGNYDSLFNDYQKLRNNYDHLQARFNKSQNELVTLERENSQLRVVVAKIEKLSFFERLFNRLPSEIKQLKGE